MFINRAKAFLMSLLLAGASMVTSLPDAKALPVGSRIPWNGGSWYLHGANLPWLNFAQDFGGGPNGGGASSSASQATLSQAFSQAQAAGMHVIRWWVFESSNPNLHVITNGSNMILRDSNNRPNGINPQVYTDINAALALAQKYDIYFDFCLFRSSCDMPQDWMHNPTSRQALANTLGKLFAYYNIYGGANATNRILSWECFNEPEWDIKTTANPSGIVSQSDCVATAKAIAASVHANCPSGAYASIGPNYYSNCAMWKGIGMDFYAPHWYDNYSSWINPNQMSYSYKQMVSQYKLDAPVVLGEIEDETSDNSGTNRLQTLYNLGYAGGLAWSLLPLQAGDGYTIDLPDATTFANANSGNIGPHVSAPLKMPLKPIYHYLPTTIKGL